MKYILPAHNSGESSLQTKQICTLKYPKTPFQFADNFSFYENLHDLQYMLLSTAHCTKHRTTAPPHRTKHRTTAPPHRTKHRTTAPPHRTTAPPPCTTPYVPNTQPNTRKAITPFLNLDKLYTCFLNKHCWVNGIYMDLLKCRCISFIGIVYLVI